MTSNIRLLYIFEYRFHLVSEFSYLQKLLQMQYNTISENSVASLGRQTDRCWACRLWQLTTLLPPLNYTLAPLLALPKQLSVHRQVYSAVGQSCSHWRWERNHKAVTTVTVGQTRHECVLSPTVQPGTKFPDSAPQIISNYHLHKGASEHLRAIINCSWN